MARPTFDVKAEARRIHAQARREQGPPSDLVLDQLAELLYDEPLTRRVAS